MSNRNILMDTTENMVRNGHLVSSATFQQLMGWASQQTVQAGLTEKRIFSMALDGEHYFPSFFADSAYDVKQLSAVQRPLVTCQAAPRCSFLCQKKALCEVRRRSRPSLRVNSCRLCAAPQLLQKTNGL